MILNLEKIRSILGNLMFAIMISLHLINYTLVAITGSDSGFSTTLYVVFFVIAIIVWIIQGKFRLEIKWMILFAILLLWHWIDSSVSRVSTIILCAYVGMPMFIVSNIRRNTERILTYTMWISLLFVPGFFIMLARTRFGNVDVDVAYSVLPSIIAGILHFAYFRDRDKKIKWLIYTIPLFYLFQLLMKGLRGPMACVLVTVILVLIIQFDTDGKLKISKMNRMLLVTSFFALIILVFFEQFLQGIIYIFSVLNIEAYFVTKTARLLNAGDLLNGRNMLLDLGWKGFLNSPIYGNGFDSFQHHTGYVYIHNFVLQSLYDGGIMYFVPLLIVFVIGTKTIFQNKNKDDITMLMFFVGFCLIYSLLSQDMYNIHYLWAFIAFMLMQRRNLNKLYEEENI